MNDSSFLVSGWDDDLEDIDEGRNPTGKLYLVQFLTTSMVSNFRNSQEGFSVRR